MTTTAFDLDLQARQFRAVFERAATGISIVSLDGRLVRANTALQQMLGYTEAELREMAFTEFTHPQDSDAEWRLFQDLTQGKREHYQMEKRYIRKDGTVFWGRLTASLVRDEDGKPQYSIRIVEDITAWKQDQEQLQRQVQRQAALRTIDLAIAGSLDLRVILNVLLDQVTGQLGVDAAAILLMDQRTQMLTYAAGRGFRTTALRYTRLRLGQGHAGQAAASRQRIAIPNLADAPGDFVRSDQLPGEGFIAYLAVPLIAKGEVKGVLEVFHRTPISPDQEWLSFLDALAGQAAIAIDSAALFGDLQRANAELTLAYDTTLEGWSRALDLRDRETEGHTQRVTELTVQIARATGINDSRLVDIRRGALLHDIGKMAIPDSILLKPGPLTEEEWVTMRRHPVYAYELLSPIPHLREALEIPYCHHEKWDGSGYPRGLGGEQIPQAARIFAVADVWDALRSDRPYRPAWSDDAALRYIREQSSKHFDPRVVEVFLKIVGPRGDGLGTWSGDPDS